MRDNSGCSVIVMIIEAAESGTTCSSSNENISIYIHIYIYIYIYIYILMYSMLLMIF